MDLAKTGRCWAARVLAVAFGAGLAGCSASAPGDDAAAGSAQDLTAGERADRATNAFLEIYFDDQTLDLRDSEPFDDVWALPSDYWKYAQSFDAVLDAVERSGGKDFELRAQRLFTGWHERPWLWHRTWFDDENWMALALLHAHRVMKEPNGDYLDLAKATFDDIWARGVTRDRRGRYTGIWESISSGSAYHTKAAVSNFGPAITAARLGRVSDAEEIYAWARAHLSDGSTGQVFDHLEADGTAVKQEQWTYNYGVAIGAAQELFLATHEAHYRDEAFQYAGYLVHHLVAAYEGHTILRDPCSTCETWGIFDGIAYRYVAGLYASKIGDGVHAYESTLDAMREVLMYSPQALWATRDDQETTFPSEWSGPRSHSTLGSESGAIMTLNIAAENGFF